MHIDKNAFLWHAIPLRELTERSLDFVSLDPAYDRRTYPPPSIG
jgi:hypothetical protein